jgi:REP element-mobilizing transposase RayT
MENYRVHTDGSVYFLTYSIVEWLPLFVSEASCKIVTDSLIYCQETKHLRINAYVIMPTHLHLIAFDSEFDSKRLLRTLADFRKFTGRQLSDYCIKHAPSCFAQTLRDQAIADRERRLWQPSRHPESIEGERFWQQKLDYLHDNPCRKGLVRCPEHWRNSSAAWYLSEGAETVDVPITQIEW